MKNKIKLLVYLLLIIAVSWVIYYIAQFLSDEGSLPSVSEISDFTVGVVSLILSIVALMISLSTYISIDSVNIISSMEGNVLCNENYNAEYQILVNRYSHCTTQASLEDELYDVLYNRLLFNSDTCMKFTDCIQDILDHILWYAYMNSKDDTYQKHVKDIVDLLDKRIKKFSNISNSNQYLLNEHIKLIKSVLNYQSVAHEGEEIVDNSTLLNIRGRLFQNSVSKTVYYDYLGLEYHKKALALLETAVGYEKEEFLLESMRLIQEAKLTPDQLDELNIYLTKAREAFDEAIISSQNDILWKGYISFNKARVDLLSALVKNNFPETWDEGISEAIIARNTVLKLLAPEKQDSFLRAEFEKEYYYAKALRLIVSAYLSQDDAEKLAEIKKEAQELYKIVPDKDTTNGSIFNRTRLYLEDII